MTRSVFDLYFAPDCVAVYGGSSDPDKLSGRPVAYLKRFGYDGDVYVVNPRRREVQGFRSFGSIGEVPGPVDLCIIVVPADSVANAVRECALAGVRAVTIFASGFSEVGEEGRGLQAAIADTAQSVGMRVIGPNCLGTFAIEERTFATFSTAFDSSEAGAVPAPLAVVTQSGAVGTFTFSSLAKRGLTASYFANTGNEADVTVAELLRELVDYAGVRVLLGHIEGAKDLSKVAEVARAARAADKPLVLLKSGRTAAGARAVGHHTGSTAGDDRAFDVVSIDEGAIRVTSMEEMADTAVAFADGRRARGPRLSIVTLSGGAGALAADDAVSAGLAVDTWKSAVHRDAVAGVLPYFGSVANPFDLTGAMLTDLTLLEETMGWVVHNDETDIILVVLGNADASAERVVEVLDRFYHSTDKPFFVAWTGGSGLPAAALAGAGVPAYPDPQRAIASIARVEAFSRSVERQDVTATAS